MRFASMLFVLVGFVVSTTSVRAGNGAPDSEHTNVGAIMVEHPVFGFIPFCSGTLIDEKVFLTAGHCTQFLEFLLFIGSENGGIDEIFVSFQQAPLDPAHFDPADPIGSGWFLVANGGIVTHPDLPDVSINPSPRDINKIDDIGALVLDSPVPESVASPALLVDEVGALDARIKGSERRNVDLVTVGYGTTPLFPPRGPNHFVDTDIRRAANLQLLNASDNFLLAQQNPAAGNSGACFGDSGGPVFVEDEDGNEVLVAIVHAGPSNCLSVGTYYRLDTLAALEFIDSVLSLVNE